VEKLDQKKHPAGDPKGKNEIESGAGYDIAPARRANVTQRGPGHRFTINYIRSLLQLAGPMGSVSPPVMMSRGRAVIWPSVIFLSAMVSLVGCRREPTETLHDAVRETENGDKAAATLATYLPKSPLPPAGLALGKTVRVIAPAGWLDHYDRVDFAHESGSADAPWFTLDAQGNYVPIDRTEGKAHAAERPVFVCHRAPAIARFEKDYGVTVEIEHYTGDEVQYTGLPAARARDFDLAFGPQSMMPLVLDQNNLAPFRVASLTRFAPVRTYITEVLGRLPPPFDWELCVPYFRYPVGVRYNQTLVSEIPRKWSDCFEFERNEFYWHRVSLRLNPFVLLGAATLYQKTLSPAELQHLNDSTTKLLRAVAELAADPTPAKNKAVRLETLRKENVLHADPMAGASGSSFGRHTAAFTTVDRLPSRAEQFRDFEVDHPENPQLRAVDTLGAASDFVKRLLVFGADFAGDPAPDVDPASVDWAYLIGSSGDPYAGLRTDPRLLFSVPGPTSIVGLDVFVMPAGRPELNRRTAEFFVDYLLIPEVAASMTEFSLRATMVRESIGFLPVEITRSEIFSLPERQDVVYLPIIAGDAERFKKLWQDIEQFRATIRSIDETSPGRRAAAAKAK
jgi:spermidine/putrescine-binding protein